MWPESGRAVARATGGALACCLLAIAAVAAEPAPFTPDDLVALERISDPQVSPDGRHVAWVQRSTDLDANRGRSDLFIAELTADGALRPRRLAPHAENDASPRFTADGRSVLFLSDRSGRTQVWRVDVARGRPGQVTDYPVDVSTFRLSPDGRWLAVSMEVFPDCADLDCTAKRLAERPKESGRRYDQLFVRHWDRWEDGTYSHLFVAPLDARGRAGRPRDLMSGIRAHVPSRPFGGDEEYAFTADGRELAWSMRPADRGEPWSTNFDIWSAPVDTPAAPRNLTAGNPAWDTQPRFLADGTMVWLAMSRPGFEADRFRVMVRPPGGTERELAPSWDHSPSSIAISHDGRSLLASADDRGRHTLWVLDFAGGAPRRLTENGQVTGFVPAPGGGAIATLADLNSAPEVHAIREGAPPRRLSAANDAVLLARASVETQQFSFAGAGGETVHGYVLKPPGLAAGARAPVAFIVHGGPQGSMGDDWSYRWNPKVFASAGYAVVMIDFHGSTGYGQAFTDSISGDWGGKPLEDLQKGLAAAIGRYDFLDGDRVCALGASYGGFMMNWIAGHWPDRFRCLVNHAGIFDTRSMYYSTEELWFPEWEFGGPAFARPESYERFNPAGAVTEWRTPMLVVHGMQDHRVPYSQGLSTFTALQRRGIPSRLLMFPDENHWILKPRNSLQWHREVLGWLAEHLR